MQRFITTFLYDKHDTARHTSNIYATGTGIGSGFLRLCNGLHVSLVSWNITSAILDRFEGQRNDKSKKNLVFLL